MLNQRCKNNRPVSTFTAVGEKKGCTYLILSNTYIIPAIDVRVDPERPNPSKHNLRSRVSIKRHPWQVN
jgi:hypothetical protein